MNPLDIELLSLCQTAKLAMLIDKQIQPKKKLRTVLPKLINKLTPEAAGRLTEFCIIITTNTPTDVQGEADRRRQLKDEALKVRMEAAIEKQNRGREF